MSICEGMLMYSTERVFVVKTVETGLVDSGLWLTIDIKSFILENKGPDLKIMLYL